MADVPEGAQLSEDGYYWWDGEHWQPVDGGQSGGGEAGGADALAQAMVQQGINIDAAALADPESVQRVTQQLNGWYEGLDETSRAVVDTLCREGMTHLLADPEVGVVQEGAEFLYALANTGQTLGDSLYAANQAIEQSGGGSAIA